MFNGIKYLRNILVSIPYLRSSCGYIDNLENPEVIAFTEAADSWLWFLAGNYQSPKVTEILEIIPEDKAIIVPSQSEEEWLQVLSRQWRFLATIRRWVLSSNTLNLETIQKLIDNLPKGFTLENIDLEVAKTVSKTWWRKRYFDYFRETNPVGFCIKEGKKVISLATGHTLSVSANNSFEVGIETLPEYRRKGLASVVGAKLIEHGLLNNIEPHWDAANQASVKLALKLGYSNPEPYNCYTWMAMQKIKEIFDKGYQQGKDAEQNFKEQCNKLLSEKKREEVKIYLEQSYSDVKAMFERLLSFIEGIIYTNIKDSEKQYLCNSAKVIRSEINKLTEFKNNVLNELK